MSKLVLSAERTLTKQILSSIEDPTLRAQIAKNRETLEMLKNWQRNGRWDPKNDIPFVRLYLQACEDEFWVEMELEMTT